MRGLNALQLALGSVGGGISGYQKAQAERLEEERKMREEARRAELDKQQETLNLFNALKAADFRFDMPEAEGPSAMPSAAAGVPTRTPTAGLGAAAPTTPISTAVTAAEQKAQPFPSTVRIGGMDLRVKAPLTPEEKAKQQTDLYRAQRKIDVDTDIEKKTWESEQKNKLDNEQADLYVQTYRGRDGKPLSRAAALAAARQGKDPIDMGYVERPMSAGEREQLGVSYARLALDREKFNQDKLTGGATPAGEIEKRLPVGARNDIADYNAAIRTLQEAMVEVDKNPGAFGLGSAMYAKGGTVGRYLRERSEGEKSQSYTRARAQMQSALMKLRKTQFGTQMTRLEKETGEEVFPSGAESPQRIAEMLRVLAGNAEQLRRGVYEANNAADLYQPITATPGGTTSGKGGVSGGKKPSTGEY